MRKNYFYPLIGVILLSFIFSFTLSTPLFAQEESEDVMDMELEDLLNVEITTAGKKAEKVSEIPASVVIVTRKEIETFGYQTVQDVINDIPGYYMLEEYYWFGTQSFGVRGFFTAQYQDNIIVLVNDVPQKEYYANSSLLNLPVEAIDRVEVVRGPLSVIYGNGAFFGAINIITNELPKSGPNSRISVSYGSDNTTRAFVRFGAQGDNFKIVGNAAIYNTDGLDTPYSDMMSSTASLGFWNAPDSTEGTLGSNMRYFDVFASYKNFRLSLNHTKVEKGAIVLGPPSVQNSDDPGTLGKQNVSRVMLGYNKEFSKKFTLDMSFNYTELNYKINYALLVPNQYGPNWGVAHGYKFEIDAFLTPSDKFKMTIGASLESALEYDNGIDLPAFGFADFGTIMKPGDSIDTLAGFMQIDWSITKKLKLTLGARVEKPGTYTLRNVIASLIDPANPTNIINIDREFEFDTIFVPRAALVYSINDKNVLKLMYGKATKIASPGRNMELAFWAGTYGLPDLVEAEIETFELNYTMAPSPKFYATVGVFHNKLNNLFTVSYITDASGAVLLAPSNGGEMTTTGFELTLKTVPGKNFHLDGSIMYQKSDNKSTGFDGIDVGYSPNVMAYIKASYEIKNGPTIGVAGRFIDKMYAGWDLAAESRVGMDVDSRFTLDLNLRWDDIFGKWYLNANVANLTGEEIRYPATTTNSGWTDKGIVGPGTTFLVTLGLKF